MNLEKEKVPCTTKYVNLRIKVCLVFPYLLPRDDLKFIEGVLESGK
jgi:hypothetical protein